MSVETKTYAEFTVPGFLFSETEITEVKSRNIQNLRIPKDAYGLRFFDILITNVSNKGKK